MTATLFLGGGQPAIDLQLVPTQACSGADDELFVEGDLMKLCPAACAQAHAALDPAVELSFGCP